MKQILYPANQRGTNDIGWLKANFSFSFANHYDPGKMNFGVLRVLNDDIIAAGKGFGTHPHDNMEIITIPLGGALEHKDSMGNAGVINAGEVQVMSAGTGVYHSEFNHSHEDAANTLQIWVFPNKRNVEPRYDQKNFSDQMKLNEWTTLVAPQGTPGDALWIHQDATFSMGEFEAGKSVDYSIKSKDNGAYIFVLEGAANINGEELGKRDAIGVYETDALTVKTEALTRLLILDVPMAL